MIKLVGMMKRKAGMSVEDFQSHWLNVHAPMIAKVPGMRRYVQSHSIPEAYGDFPQAYDGMAEAWFDDLEAYRAGVASPAWQEAVVDAANFIGTGGARLMASEVAIVPAYESPRERASLVKYNGFLTRLPHLSVEEFQAHWRNIHAPLVVNDLKGMVRYIQNHALQETYGGDNPPSFDGVPQAWFESIEAVPPGLGRPRPSGQAKSAANIDSESVFVQPIPAMLAREIVIVD
jgi:uncharacterized protein (TIGR02118 family)